jgi:hypothetical protein
MDCENAHPNQANAVRDPMAMLLAAKQEAVGEQDARAAESLQKKVIFAQTSLSHANCA